MKAHTLGGGFNLSFMTNGMPSREENREPIYNTKELCYNMSTDVMYGCTPIHIAFIAFIWYIK